jgi:hypothetical protein
MARKIKRRCSGCRLLFDGTPGDIWCPRCVKDAETITVELCAEQLKILESLAYVRGETVEQVVRAAIDMLGHRDKARRFVPVNESTLEYKPPPPTRMQREREKPHGQTEFMVVPKSRKGLGR